MKKMLLSIAIIILGISIVYSQDTAKAKLLTKKFKFPSIDVKTLDGKTFNTSQLTNNGKPIIVSFWAMWCTNCI
ncbi:MAG: hypothetical protein ABR968_06410, partial [Bacteroidales bacterium]